MIADNTEQVLFRAEFGVGVAHGRTDSSLKTQESVANTLNGKNITLQARRGDINLERADLTGRDSNGNRLADSAVTLNALKDINLTAGTDFYKQKSSGQNVGVEVGTAFSVGANTGWSLYAKVGYGSNKSGDERTAYQNTFIDTETLNLKSGANTTLRGTTALADTINADIGKDLILESQQDQQHQSSRSMSAGLQIEFGFGSAWDFRLSGSGNRAGSHFKQVGKQTGLFAEEGGYHIHADNVTLTGGAIASRNQENSELTTNTLTFRNIRNESRYQALSLSADFSMGQKDDRYFDKDTHKEKTRESDRTYTVKGQKYATPNLGLPMYESDSDSSLTKATLTEGKITLNKDTQPTETTAKALGINTEINLANDKVNAPKDINQVLYEQGKISEAVGKIVGAVETYAANKRSEAAVEMAAAENARHQAIERGDKTAEVQANNAILLAKAKQENWGIGGNNYQTAKTISAITGAILAGQSTAQVATAALSPTANNLIHEATKDSKTANLLAHAVLSAVEFKAAGLDSAAGALAGIAGEGTAMLLAEKVYNKPIEALNQSEKELLKTASMIAGGLVGGATTNGSATANAIEGVATAERAVENNYAWAAKMAGSACLKASSCKNILVKPIVKDIAQVTLAAGIIQLNAEKLSNMIDHLSSDEFDHLLMVYMMGNNKLMTQNILHFSLKYSILDPTDIPKLGGFEVIESKPTILTTPVLQPNGKQTLETPIYEQGKDDNVLVGGEIQVGNWNDHVIVSTNYIETPKKKVNSAKKGDIVRTPTSHPEDFTKHGQQYKNNYTDEIWEKSNTKHSDKLGEWKVGLGKNRPSKTKKITVGVSDGKIIKFDNK
ncbi:VENN motif-containing pre-toxin protein [Cricetibacter osteomyelitidis]|uniref:VENN motif-containing pre-toxin protein n=1 Tax=Cricetibacter osteomyelitidis TaxID=1521931 RepID=A0A4V2T130_9PAST|nr:hemagglutinin repeat-containing protein [Cricetibacter osteomyelitidis]TCP92063.1 VENN motif-containing pre-toxin protein [Cricetibacter osteomyelitidis]